MCANFADSDLHIHKVSSGPRSPFIHSVVFNDSVSGQWRPWSDCADAQADLGLRCSHMPEDTLNMARPNFVIAVHRWASARQTLQHDLFYQRRPGSECGVYTGFDSSSKFSTQQRVVDCTCSNFGISMVRSRGVQILRVNTVFFFWHISESFLLFVWHFTQKQFCTTVFFYSLVYKYPIFYFFILKWQPNMQISTGYADWRSFFNKLYLNKKSTTLPILFWNVSNENLEEKSKYYYCYYSFLLLLLIQVIGNNNDFLYTNSKWSFYY